MTQTQTAVWSTNSDAYRRKLEGLLGDRDPIAVMSQTADVLPKSSSNIPQLMPFPGNGRQTKSSAILPTEWVYGYRERLILCEDKPTILGMDQDLWVAGQQHNDRDPKELVEMFRALRQYNLLVWRKMGSDELSRIGQHNERGAESLGQMLRMEAGHDVHIDQINRYLDAAKKMA
jgi:hypothetical protein